MNIKISLFAAALFCAGAGLAFGDDFNDASGILRDTIIENRAGGGAQSDLGIKAVPVQVKSSVARAPKDDLKASVLRHLDGAIAYCGRNLEDCNGANGQLRDFAAGIGGGRCNNRGFNCVGEVLEICRDQAAGGEVTPMYYMACAAMLGKMGERSCAEGRASCAGYLQGSVYFSLRAAAGCHKSFEKDKEGLAAADGLIARFAGEVKRDVKDVYVGHVERAQSITRLC